MDNNFNENTVDEPNFLHLFPIHLLSPEVLDYIRSNEYYSNQFNMALIKFINKLKVEHAKTPNHDIQFGNKFQTILEDAEKSLLTLSNQVNKKIQTRPDQVHSLQSSSYHIDIPVKFPIGEVDIDHNILTENTLFRTQLVRIIKKYNSILSETNAHDYAVDELNKLATQIHNFKKSRKYVLKSGKSKFAEKGFHFPLEFPNFNMDDITIITDEPKYVDELNKIISEFDKNNVNKTLKDLKNLKNRAYNNANAKKTGKRKRNELNDFANYWGNEEEPEDGNKTQNGGNLRRKKTLRNRKSRKHRNIKC